MISSVKFNRRQVNNAVPQVVILGSIPCSIFINDIDDGIECTLCEFGDGKNSGGVVDQMVVLPFRGPLLVWENGQRGSHEGQQREMLILHLVRNNPMRQYRLGTDGLESSFAEKNLGVLADTKLTMEQQCVLREKKKNKSILDCIINSISSRLR